MGGHRFAVLLAAIVAFGVAPVSAGAATRATPSTFHPVAGGTWNGVACGSSTRCVVVGAGLVSVRVSSDGGNTWAKATQPINGVPNAIACPTASLCIAVGRTFGVPTPTGAAWRSTNGGMSWSAPTITSGHPLTDVACVSATRCLTNNLVSTNGGATWANSGSSVTGFGCDRSGSAHCIGLTTSGAIVYSTNGGATWSPSTTPSGMHGVRGGTCASATACYVPSADLGVLRSTNGGQTFTWGNLSLTYPPDWVNNIACQTATRCVLTGAFHDSEEVGDQQPLAAYTTNGWVAGDGGAGPASDGWAACTASRCMNAGTAISTADDITSGHWTTRMQLVAGVNPIFGSIASGIACPSATHCVQTNNLSIAYSNDGGQTWATGYSVPDYSYEIIGAPACASALRCFVGLSDPGNGNAILETLNGGATWTEDYDFSASAIACPTSTHCIADDDLDWTPTGGWVYRATNYPVDAGLMTCGAPTRCYVGESDGVYVSPDLGNTWTRVSTRTDITKVTCVDAMHCDANSGSAIVRTANGGSTWTTARSSATLFACNAAARCLGKTSSAIIDSTDGGATWHSDHVRGALPTGTDARCRGSFCVVVGPVTLRTP